MGVKKGNQTLTNNSVSVSEPIDNAVSKLQPGIPPIMPGTHDARNIDGGIKKVCT